MFHRNISAVNKRLVLPPLVLSSIALSHAVIDLMSKPSLSLRPFDCSILKRSPRSLSGSFEASLPLSVRWRESDKNEGVTTQPTDRVVDLCNLRRRDWHRDQRGREIFVENRFLHY